MNLDPYVADLAEALAAATEVGGEETRRTAGLLLAVLEPSARLALLTAMSDVAAEATHVLDGPLIELRLDGGEVDVVVTPAEPPPAEPEPEPAPVTSGVGEETIRITLRLPESLKNRAEEAALHQGRSLNAWLTDAVQAAVLRGGAGGGTGSPSAERPAGRSSRISGWVTG